MKLVTMILKKYVSLLVSYYFDANNIKELREQLEEYIKDPPLQGAKDLEDFITMSKFPDKTLEKLLKLRNKIIDEGQKSGALI